MCGRFSLVTYLSVIIQSFGIQEVDYEYRVSNNISPTEQVPAIIHDDKTRLVDFRWGLIPYWAKEPSIGNKLINARAETVATKPSFKNAFKRHRCLIVADAFYEWVHLNKVKKPFHFSLRSGAPFGFAGLYDTWMSPEKRPIRTCTIITTDANDLVMPIHERMPVIVPKDKEGIWIDMKNQDRKELEAILKPYPAEEMKMTEGFVPVP